MGGTESTPEDALPFIEFCEPYQSYIMCFTKISHFCEYALKEECVHKELDDHGKPCYIQHDGAGSFKVVDYKTKLNCFDKYNPKLAALYNAQVNQWRDQDSKLLEVCYKLMREDTKLKDLKSDCEKKFRQVEDNCLRCKDKEECDGVWLFVRNTYTDLHNELIQQNVNSCDYFKEQANPGQTNCFPTDTLYEECEDEKLCKEDSKGNCTCENETTIISRCVPTFHNHDGIKKICEMNNMDSESCGQFLHLTASECRKETDKSKLISNVEFPNVSVMEQIFPEYAQTAKIVCPRVNNLLPPDVSGLTCGFLLQHAGELKHDTSFNKMNSALQKINIL